MINIIVTENKGFRYLLMWAKISINCFINQFFRLKLWIKLREPFYFRNNQVPWPLFLHKT